VERFALEQSGGGGDGGNGEKGGGVLFQPLNRRFL
jgi:hypothetical protein